MSSKSDAQRAAEELWRVATSDGPEARYDHAVYRAAEERLMSALRAAYGLTQGNAQAVLDKLAEYGPADHLMWNVRGYRGGRGVESYVARVYADRSDARREAKRDAARTVASYRREEWRAARQMPASQLAARAAYSRDLATGRMFAAQAQRRMREERARPDAIAPGRAARTR